MGAIFIGEEGYFLADYVISAILRLHDQMSGQLKSAAKAVSDINKTIAASTSKGVNGISRGVADISRGIKDVSKGLGSLDAGSLARIERLKGVLDSAGMKTPPINIRANDGATSKIEKIKAELKSLAGKNWDIAVNLKDNAKAAFGNAKNKISSGISEGAMMAGATAMGLGAVGGMTYTVADAFKSQMDFEKELSSVKAIMSGAYQGDKLESVMKELTAEAERLGATTKFTAAEVATAMRYEGMAGWRKEQMVAGTGSLLDLAAAGDVDLGTAADILTDNLTAFGLKAGEFVKHNGRLVESSKHYADLMAALVTTSNTDVQQAGEALKYAAPVVQSMYANADSTAKMAGAEDTLLVTGLMANSGIKGSQAGTSIRAMLQRLSSQNRNAYFAQNALGIEFADESGEARRLKDIVADFRKIFKQGVDVDKVADFFEQAAGMKIHADTRRKLTAYQESVMKNGGKMSGTEAMKMTSMLAGQEAMSGWLATFLASDEDFEKLAEALEKAEGASARMAEIRMDNLAGDVTKLGSAWDAFQRSFVKGDASAGLRSFTKAITDTLSKANELFKDGIDASDLGAIVVDVVAKLKAKFLELDGIGSLLAGGTLVFGLKKVLSLALKVKDTLSTWTKVRTAGDVGNIIRGGAAGTGGLQSIGTMTVNAGTMNVRAGVVNLTGAIRGGTGGAGGRGGATVLGGAGGIGGRGGIGGAGTIIAGGAAGASAKILTATQIAQQKAERSALVARQAQARADSLIATAWSRPADASKIMAQYEKANTRAIQAQARANDAAARYAQLRVNDERAASYYAKREAVTLQQRYAADVVAAQNEATAQKYANRRAVAGTAAGGAAMGAVFGIMDFAATRTTGNYNLSLAKEDVDLQRNELKNLQQNNASVEQINAQLEKIRQAENNFKQVTETNAANERRAGAGATGMIAGTAIGAAIGSFVPVIGNMVGGMLGGVIGQKVGEYAADSFEPLKHTQKFNEAEIADNALNKYSAHIAKRRQLERIERENPAEYAKIQTEKTVERERALSEFALSNKNTGANVRARTEDARISSMVRSERLRVREEQATAALKESNQIRENIRENAATIETVDRRSGKRGVNYTRKEVFGGTSLGNPNESAGWADSRGTGIQTVNEYDAKVQRQRDDFERGMAPLFSKISANTTEGRERAEWLLGTEESRERWTKPKNFTAPFNATGTGSVNPLDGRQGFAQTTSLIAPSVTKNASIGGLKQLESEISTETVSTQPVPTTVAPEVAAAGTKTLEQKQAESRAGLKTPATAPRISTASDISGQAAAISTTPMNFGQPDFSQIQLPEINLAEKITSGIESASNAISSFKESAVSKFSEISTDISTALDNAKSAVTSGITEISTGLSETFTNVTNSVSEKISSFATDFSTGFENVKTFAATTLSELSTTFSTGFENLLTSAMTNVESLSTSLVTGFESLSTSVAATMDNLSMSVSMGLETMSMTVSTILDSVSMTFSTSFETILSTASATFSNITATISANVEMAHAAISSAFSSAAAEVQGIWGAIPGFFSGVFGGLGGIAAAAGSAIAAGINSGIGMIQSAWEGLSGWLSSKIASLSAMASSAAAAIGIGGNYKGTSSWHGGFTTVNEHGGELIILPNGEKIYPQVTTMNALGNVAHNYTGTSYFSGGDIGGWSEVNGTGSELMYLPRGTKIINHPTTVSILRRQIRENLKETGYDNNSILQQPAGKNTNTLANTAGSSIPSSESPSASQSAVFNKLQTDRHILRRQIREKLKERERNENSISNAVLQQPAGKNTNTLANTADVRRSVLFQQSVSDEWQTSSNFSKATRTDSLGNLQGVNIPEYNRITAEDSIIVRRAKQEAQRGMLNIAHNYGGTSYFTGDLLDNQRESYFEQRAQILRDKSYLSSSQISQSAEQTSTYKTDSLVNIVGLSGLADNVISADDSTAVQRAKQNERKCADLIRKSETPQSFGSKTVLNAPEIAHNYGGTSYFGGGLSTVNEHGGEIITFPTGDTIYPQATAQNILQRELQSKPQIDSLGNIQNLNVPEYNRITSEDSLTVRRAKYQAQIQQFRNDQQSNRTYNAIAQNSGGTLENRIATSQALTKIRRQAITKEATQNVAHNDLLSSTAQITNQDISRTSEITQNRADNRKNFLQKGTEAVNDFFYRLFHSRKSKGTEISNVNTSVLQQSPRSDTAPATGQAVSQNEVQINSPVQRNSLANIRRFDGRSFSANDAAVQNAVVSNTSGSRKNFLQKGAESVNDFFYRIFHPRKYKAQRDIQQGNYQTDGLGNIIGLNISSENHIDGTDTPTVRQAKQAAQQREYVNQRGRLAPVYSTSTTVDDREYHLRENPTNTLTPIVSERAAFFSAPASTSNASVAQATTPVQTFSSTRINRAQEIRSRVERDAQALSRVTGKPAPQMGASLPDTINETAATSAILRPLTEKSPLSSDGTSLTKVSSTDSLIQLGVQEPFNGVSTTALSTKDTRKNFLQKGVESVSNYLHKIFHPRKYKEQQEARRRGFRRDKLGNIIGLNGLPDNVITGTETEAVKRAKRAAREDVFKQLASSTTSISDTSIFGAYNSTSTLSDTSQFFDSTTGKFHVSKPNASSQFNIWALIKSIVGGAHAISYGNSRPKSGWLNALAAISSIGSTIFGGRRTQNQSSATYLGDTLFGGDSTSTLANSFAPATSAKFNTWDALVNLWQHSKKPLGGITFDSVLRPVLSYSGGAAHVSSGGVSNFSQIFSPNPNNLRDLRAGMLNRLNFSSSFNAGELPAIDGFEGSDLSFGDLPVPQFGFADIAKKFKDVGGNSISNSSTSNSSSSTNNFNFGDVNINNSADFDEFVNRLKNMLRQSAGNYAG